MGDSRSSSRLSAGIVSEPTKIEHPGVPQRKADYRLLKKIEGKLQRRRKCPVFNASELHKVLTVCSSPFPIDQDNPIDYEARYFNPGSMDDLELGLNLSPRSWTVPAPIEYQYDQNGQLDVNVTYVAFQDMIERGAFCACAVAKVSKWAHHEYVPLEAQFGEQDAWYTPSGHLKRHWYRTGEFYMWPRGEDLDRYKFNSDIPHSVATVWDTIAPGSDGILWSELLLAVTLLKGSVRDANMYPHHRVCPGLLLSIHGRFSARIIQVHIQDEKLVIRPSRLLNFHTPTISHDVRLALRWLNCTPTGDTKQSPLRSVKEDDEEGVKGSHDTEGPPRHSIPVGGRVAI